MGFVQSASGSNNTLNGAVAVTFGSSATAHNTLIAGFGSGADTANGTISGITIGGAADNWASAETAYNNSFDNAAIWYDENCAGGSAAVSVAVAGQSGTNPANAAIIIEWNGIIATGGLDKKNTANNQTATPSSGSTGTLTQAAEVGFGVICCGAGFTLTLPSSPWTNLSQVTDSGGVLILGIGYQQVSATTALTYSGTISSADFWGACIATFELGGNITVNLPLAQSTDKAFTLTPSFPPPVIVNLPLTQSADAAFPVTPQYTNPALVWSIIAAQAGVPDPVLGIQCNPGFTSFKAGTPGKFVQVQAGAVPNIQLGNPGAFTPAAILTNQSGELVTTSGLKTNTDQSASMVLEAAGNTSSGDPQVQVGGTATAQLTVNGTVMTVP